MTDTNSLFGIAYTDAKHHILRAEILAAADDWEAVGKAWASMPRRARDFQLVTSLDVVARGLPAIVATAEEHLSSFRRD